MAEALGMTGSAQVMDLSVNDGNNYTPTYAIYKNDIPVCMALINFRADKSGTSAYTVSISISGGDTGQPASTPSSIKVKYLSASSVSQKANFTWAGQTSDGRPMGEEYIQTIQCDLTSNTCQILVPTPSFALVFLNDKPLEESMDGGNGEGGEVTMYSTTAVTKTMNTAKIDQEVLATSNGHWAGDLPHNSDISVSNIEAVKAYLSLHPHSSTCGIHDTPYSLILNLDNSDLCQLYWESLLKHGKDLSHPDNYCAIALESCFLKFGILIVLHKLTKAAEDGNLIPASQNGFCAGHCTQNNAFILRSLIKCAQT
ncbi:hypothetical protein D9758_016183 [Tetrapyrgos nigripes]|uniref:Beta-glucuronidase C-terminal domain-containing protein n=1 Tax=Tetrapyrgos nigripes TaxID=182062 RepID=A0A8H5C4U5_9AGAR|nr:hypothetical protein D9758_016183 [Tetrapyrgos nigripes]